ncbi:hypothetical protein ACQZ6I_03050, partial [Agrobacterium vitis]
IQKYVIFYIRKNESIFGCIFLSKVIFSNYKESKNTSICGMIACNCQEYPVVMSCFDGGIKGRKNTVIKNECPGFLRI